MEKPGALSRIVITYFYEQNEEVTYGALDVQAVTFRCQ